ncbi:MAG: aminotransferase class I/II-fold pyridoxal phosphate-dependent enzyme, partial [Bacteroidota bacterium]
MNNRISRRTLLRKTALAAGGATLGAALPWGAVASPQLQTAPFWHNKPRALTRPFPYQDYPLKAKLNANENKYGPSKLATKAIVEYANGGNLYAHKEVMELVAMLAEKEGVKPEQIILGPGSTDLLEKIAVMSFMDGKGNVISADPAYMSVVRTAQRVGAEWKNIASKPDWSHDLDAMYAAIDGDTRLIYVCNPNNP